MPIGGNSILGGMNPVPEESFKTSEASSISESNIRDQTGTIDLGDGNWIVN